MSEQSLIAIKEKIQQFIQQGYFTEAGTILTQYSAVMPTDPDTFSLKAMLYQAQGNANEAINVLSDGLRIYPLRFDLLANLGIIFEHKKDYLEAYHLYIRASYLAEEQSEHSLVIENLKRIMPHFKGKTKLEINDDYIITTSLSYGEKSLIVKTDINRGNERNLLLHTVVKHFSEGANKVLEIEFGSGVISKNLNYYGFDVEAIDSRKGALLELISKEWQENLRQPEQKKAKYFHNHLTLADIPHLSHYDVIILAPNHNDWYQDVSEQLEIVKALLEKANQQLFVKLPILMEANDIRLNYFKEKGFEVTCILEDQDHIGYFELFLIERENRVKGRFTIPNGTNVKSSRSTIVEVDISKCCDKYGFSYNEEGFHPFVETIKQYRENKNVTYDASVLKKFYQLFKPRNLSEAFFYNEDQALSLLKKGWVGYPWLWNEKLRVIVEDNPGETRPGGNHFFGPNTDKFGIAEMGRLTTSCEMLDNIGYLPELFADGYVTGYMLKYKDDYRFIITEGQHRIAAIAALGYKKIECRFSQSDQYPRIVDFKDVKKWPQVKNGTYSRKSAEKVFMRFFEINGKERAQQCGLLDKL
ncbi:hypothetical protein RJD24_19490 [Bacillaceae bacterium IKA-2]|nr:hypothetical protein RJD24_19490 [Bacillaceae bacterium IKA-2]